jgi:hypothetical protein
LRLYVSANYPSRKVEIVPEMVVKKRYALTANPLFSGEIALISMVIAGELQHSANKYSKNNAAIEIGKLVWIRQQTAIIGQPKKLPTLKSKIKQKYCKLTCKQWI